MAAGPCTPVKASEIWWYGSQPGKAKLAGRKVKVQRPRLRQGRRRSNAYEALQKDRSLGQRMPGALMRSVSAREYQKAPPKMAATEGVSRSSISRHAIEASAEQLKQLRERRWDDVEILAIYIDRQRFGSHHVLSAVGVDAQGEKHILGLEPARPRMPPRSSVC